jgi:hypothetical protein
MRAICRQQLEVFTTPGISHHTVDDVRKDIELNANLTRLSARTKKAQRPLRAPPSASRRPMARPVSTDKELSSAGGGSLETGPALGPVIAATARNLCGLPRGADGWWWRINRRAGQVIPASEGDLRSPASRTAEWPLAHGCRPIAAHRNGSLDSLRGRQHRRTQNEGA